jgi:hypothetical protein
MYLKLKKGEGAGEKILESQKKRRIIRRAIIRGRRRKLGERGGEKGK